MIQSSLVPKLFKALYLCSVWFLSVAQCHLGPLYREFALSASDITMIIFGDSRCRRLQPYLVDTDITVYYYSGANLEGIVSNAIPIIRAQKPLSVLIMGGVNDLTILNRRPRWVSLRFHSESEMSQAIMSTIGYLRGLLAAEFPGLKVSF